MDAGDGAIRAEGFSDHIFRSGKQVLSEIGRLQLRAKRSINSDIVGRYRSAFRGKGLLFSELREYQPGDDIKQIHWKASAGTGKIFIKSYEEERELRILLAVDMSRSLNCGRKKTNFQKALEFAAAVSVLAERVQDSVGLCLFSDSVHEFLPPTRSQFSFQKIVKMLCSERELGAHSDLNPLLGFLNERLRKHTVLFIISDFYSRKPFLDHLRPLAQRHDVVLACVIDELELRLPNSGLVTVRDQELSDTIVIDTNHPRLGDTMHRYQVRRLTALTGMARQAGADFVAVRDNAARSLIDLMNQRVSRLR